MEELEKKYELKKEIRIKIPNDLNKESQPNLFSDFSTSFNPVPGKEYLLKIFSINEGSFCTIQDNVTFLKSKNAIFMGTYGVLLINEIAKDELPKKNSWYFSFGSLDNASGESDFFSGILHVNDDQGGDYCFSLESLEAFDIWDWTTKTYILCFCEVD